MTSILHNTVYKTQEQHLLHVHLLKEKGGHFACDLHLLDQIAALIHTLL